MLGGFAGLVGLSAVAGVLVTATVTPAIAITSNAATGAITLFDNLPSYLEIEQLMLPTTFYYKNADTGEWQELTQFYDQNRSPVSYDEVAPVMYDAILSSEDPRYYDHGGVDLIGTTRALLSNAQGGGATQGGSSISQQYVKNILIQRCERDAPDQQAALDCWYEAVRSDGTEGIQRKVQEMRYAISLEQKYSKNDILLGYLNIANFGGQTYGIDAAARYYFGVPASDLSLGQAATLAGMVQNPNAYRIDKPKGSMQDAEGNPINSEADGYAQTKKRQSYVLERMLDDGKITQADYDAAIEEPIVPDIHEPKTGCIAAGGSAYFCQYVKYIIRNDPAFGATQEERDKALQQGGLKVYTTLDIRLQIAAETAMVNNVPSTTAGIGKFGSTSVSVDPRTGKILSIVQNTKFSEDATLKDDLNYSSIVFAGDSTLGGSIGFNAGSTFKLFTLVEWLQQGKSLNQVLNGTIRTYPRFTNSCTGDWVNVDGWKPDNFGGGGGYVGTPMRFTAQSLNTGFFAMANELDLCNIGKTAKKMGVTTGDGQDITMQNVNAVIGSDNVSPLAMASAYGTVANNGIYCQPRAIERIVGPDGEDKKLPERSCEQVLTPEVAATAAYALQGVMTSGGTGSSGNPYDGTPLIGKTGTHQEYQTWLIESSTNAATAVWVGNWEGTDDLFRNYVNGVQLSQLRYTLARQVQGAADALYGGNPFPNPDPNLMRQVLVDLPNVIGRSVDDATNTLRNAGFDVIVGEVIDSPEAEGTIGAQSPGAGRVAGGTTVTINPSNGQGVSVPDVTGQDPASALGQLNSAGFSDIAVKCEERKNAPDEGRVTRTDPPANSVTNRDARITVTVSAKDCGGIDE